MYASLPIFCANDNTYDNKGAHKDESYDYRNNLGFDNGHQAVTDVNSSAGDVIRVSSTMTCR